jgi:putative phosphoesterase
MPAEHSKIALLGDVHANLPALEAVLSHAKKECATTFWNIGDFVGYGAFPDQVVRLSRKEKFESIIGNYDLKVLNFPKKDKKWRKKKHPLKWLAFKWAHDNLSKKSRKFLRGLPEQKILEVGDLKFLLVHASPASNEELLEPDTSQKRLLELSQLAESTYGDGIAAIIFGHSHQAFIRQAGDTYFVNTGSVGRPDDGDPRATYAILQVDSTGTTFQHFRVDYDVDGAVAAIRQNKLPEAFAQMLIRGRDLETVLREMADEESEL